MTQLSEADFERIASTELDKLLEALIELEDIDPDLASGVLSIVFEDGTKYVVNSHRAARQIWMAAERRAWHFGFETSSERWIAEQSSDELWSTLTDVLSRKLEQAVKLS